MWSFITSYAVGINMRNDTCGLWVASHFILTFTVFVKVFLVPVKVIVLFKFYEKKCKPKKYKI